MDSNIKSLLNDYKKKIIIYLPKIGISFIILIIFIFGASLIEKKIINDIEKKDKYSYENHNKLLYYILSKVLYYLIISIGIFISLSILGFNLTSLFIMFGSVGLALALSVQSTFSQLISGFIIIFFNYFNIGDLVQINNNLMGYVYEFNLINTKIIDISDTITIIPNVMVTNGNFINYYNNKQIYLRLFIKLSTNNNIDYDLLFNDIKNGIIKECIYVYDKNKVIVDLYDMSSYGTELYIKIFIDSKNYYKALFSANLIIRKILNNYNILLLDNNYLFKPNQMS